MTLRSTLRLRNTLSSSIQPLLLYLLFRLKLLTLLSLRLLSSYYLLFCAHLPILHPTLLPLSGSLESTSNTAANPGLIVKSSETNESELGMDGEEAIVFCSSSGFQRDDRIQSNGLGWVSTWWQLQPSVFRNLGQCGIFRGKPGLFLFFDIIIFP